MSSGRNKKVIGAYSKASDTTTPKPLKSDKEPDKDIKLHYVEISRDLQILGSYIKGDFKVNGPENSHEGISKSIESLKGVIENLCDMIHKEGPENADNRKSKTQRNTLTNPISRSSNVQSSTNRGSTPNKKHRDLSIVVNKLFKENETLNADFESIKKENTEIKTKLDSLCSELGVDSSEKMSPVDLVNLISKENKKMSSDLESLNLLVKTKSKDDGIDTKLSEDKTRRNKKETLSQLNSKITKTTESKKIGDKTGVTVFREFKENLPDIISAINDGREMKYMISELKYFADNNGRQTTIQQEKAINPTSKGNQSSSRSQQLKVNDKNKTKNGKDDYEQENQEPAKISFEDLKRSFKESFQCLKDQLNKVTEEHSQCAAANQAFNATVLKCIKIANGIMETKEEPDFNTEGLPSTDDAEINSGIEVLVHHAVAIKTKLWKYRKIKDPDEVVVEIKTLKKENDDLQLRLSKVAGAKLTEGNPSITNLSDSNRPMKIADAFSEFYDDEWTEVMDECCKGKIGKKFDENTIIKHLSEIVMRSYCMCEKKAGQYTKNVATILSSVTSTMMMTGCEEQVLKHVIEVRRSAAESSADEYYKGITKKQKDIAKEHFSKLDPSVVNVITASPFYEKCIKLCWKMVLQDPPMVLKRGPDSGKPYDKSEFREYTSSGKTVVFTVWPALLLHENGPLLKKGVVKVQ